MRTKPGAAAARRITRKRAAISIAIALGAVACSTAPRIETADDLVTQLRNSGIQLDSQEPAPTPNGNYFRFDEGVRLKGPDLFVDILRIEDERVFGIAKSAGVLLAVAEVAADQHIPDNPVVYARHPFVVIIRLQPDGANMEGTLAKLLPPEQE